MALDTWYSVSGVYDGEFAKLYINGELIGETQGAAIAPVNATDYPLEIANIEIMLQRFLMEVLIILRFGILPFQIWKFNLLWKIH